MDSKIFRYSGVGSKAWYIKRIKIGQDGRTGFTYLRGDSVADGKALLFNEIKSAMSQLVAAGYVKRHSKPDAPRSDKYEVTSFGHRYLDEHEAELEPPKDTASHVAVKPGVEHHVPQIPPFKPSLPSVIVPPAPTPRPLDRVVHAAIEVGQEIEKHKAAKSISPPDPEISPVPEQRSDTPTGLETGTPGEISPLDNTNLIAQLKTIAGEILYERNAGLVSVKDIVEHLEKKK